METEEAVVVNGSHEPENEKKDEKILKPRKPSHATEDVHVIQNGKSEDGSTSDKMDNENMENGYDEETECDDTSKQQDKNLRQQNIGEKKEGTPKKSLKRSNKESTPNPDTLPKRELRRREVTPKESTPKRESPAKREYKRRGTPSKVHQSESSKEAKQSHKGEQNETEEIQNDNVYKEKLAENLESLSNKKTVEQVTVHEERDIFIDEMKPEDNLVVSVSETEEELVVEKPKKGGFLGFRRSPRGNASVNMKDACEASSSSSSPSLVCLGSPSLSEEMYEISFNKDIKSRKPLNSFSRFPGRTVSITSLDSLKRKADDSFIEDDGKRKRFAGDIESGSEKSPGWQFFSPTFSRVWTPTPEKHLKSSTPLYKRTEEDSVAVILNEDTNLSLAKSEVHAEAGNKGHFPTKTGEGKWCTIM